MGKFFKSVALVLMLAMVFMVAGCNGGDEPPVDDPDDGATGDVEDNGGDEGEEPEEVPSMALVLNGPINDMGWNASAYAGLMQIEEEFGADVSFSESVTQSDMEEVFRNYASAGFDVIFGHGSQFTDAIKAVAPNFPDSMFIILNGMEANGTNIASVQVADEEQGFLMGAFAALMTETGKVGVIGGAEIPPITNAVKGYSAGAEYVDPEVEVLSSMTGSFEDVNAAKETALTYIDQGADYIGAIANQAGLGSIEACEERGVYTIGANQDQFDLAPSVVVVSMMKETPIAYMYAYEQFKDGNLESDIYRLGAGAGVIFMSPYHDFEDFVPQEVKDRMDEIIEELSNNEINILG